MKTIILLADYFEDMEAFITIDMLRRANIQIDLVSVTGKLDLITQSNISIKADKLFSDINEEDYECLIIPGGKAVLNTLHKDSSTREIIKHFEKNHKLIACICAAPSILGKYGLLDDKEYTCFPTFERFMPKGTYHKEAKVIVCDNLITSKAAGTAFEFSEEIIKALKGKKVAEEVISSVYYK